MATGFQILTLVDVRRYHATESHLIDSASVTFYPVDSVSNAKFTKYSAAYFTCSNIIYNARSIALRFSTNPQ